MCSQIAVYRVSFDKDKMIYFNGVRGVPRRSDITAEDIFCGISMFSVRIYVLIHCLFKRCKLLLSVKQIHPDNVITDLSVIRQVRY